MVATARPLFLPFRGLGGYASQFGAGPWSELEFQNSELVPQPFTASGAEAGTRCASCRAELSGADSEG